MVRLLDNEPANRVIVEEVLADLQPYFDLAPLPVSIPRANFEKVKTAIHEFELVFQGSFEKFTRDIDK